MRAPHSGKYDVSPAEAACLLAFPPHRDYNAFKFLVGSDEEWVHPVPLFFVTDPRAKERMEQAEGTDDRIIRETGTEARVAAIIAPALDAIGFRLVRVRLLGQNGLTLQVMAERPDGSMTIEDCEEASRALSAVLDVEDPIEKAYHLEVSSPGIDRSLVRKSDFETAVGHLVKIETSVMVEGRKRFRGRITQAAEDAVTIERDQASYGDEPVVSIFYDSLAEAKLVLTDDLIREALKQDKKLRQERRRHGKSGEGEAGDNDNEE
jgi:ribosome maturation factor RimP